MKVSASKRLSVVNPATAKQLAAVPDVDRVFLNKAISAARNAFAGWNAAPVERRKTILARLLNTIGDHAHELSALLATEQGGALAQARWEIALLTKAFGPDLIFQKFSNVLNETALNSAPDGIKRSLALFLAEKLDLAAKELSQTCNAVLRASALAQGARLDPCYRFNAYRRGDPVDHPGTRSPAKTDSRAVAILKFSRVRFLGRDRWSRHPGQFEPPQISRKTRSEPGFANTLGKSLFRVLLN